MEVVRYSPPLIGGAGISASGLITGSSSRAVTAVYFRRERSGEQHQVHSEEKQPIGYTSYPIGWIFYQIVSDYI